MKREEVIALFPDATEEQIDKIMDMNGKDINSTKAKLSTDKAELERLKTIEEEYQKTKDASLTAEEKYQKLLKDSAEKEKQYSVQLNRIKAENVLVSAGYKVEEIGDLFDGIVTEDTDATVKRATGLATLLKSKSDAAAKSKEAELLQGMTPPPAGGGNETTITKEQFKGMTYQQMADLKASNPTLFTQLNS
jgi:hypothetical protein